MGCLIIYFLIGPLFFLYIFIFLLSVLALSRIGKTVKDGGFC